MIEAPESVRVRVLRDAEVPDDRPSILRGDEGAHEQGVQWVRRNLSKIVAPLLRYADLDDDTVAFLASEGSIGIGEPVRAPARLFFPFLEPSPGHPQGSMDLTELAASAALVQELLAALARANVPFAVEATPPRVRVSAEGPIGYELDGGLLTAGAALVITATSGVVPAVIAAQSAGAMLGSMDRRAGGERGGPEQRSTDPFHRKPAAALVRREAVRSACERYRIPEAYANHLLNRVLPTAAKLTATGVRVELRG